MEPQDFLDVVLPTQGLRCVGVLKDRQFRNYTGTTNRWLLDGVKRVSDAGTNVFYALASFKEKGKRTQDNVLFVRSFWLDIDTQEGKDGERYADRREALQALLAFTNEIGLPQPYVVSSGYGLHVYWPTLENMDPDTWKQTALLLKQATKVWQLAVDQTRTADSASVLRPPGVRNYKRGSSREVKVVLTGVPAEHASIHVALERWLEERGSLPEVFAPPSGESLNGDLMTKPEYRPSSAIAVSDACPVMAVVRDTQGNVTEPVWYGAMGILAHCIEGEELAHEWSRGHPSYSRAETAAKFRRASEVGPTTCARFSDFMPQCQTCVHFGKIKSPISLGVKAPALPPEPTPPAPDGDDRHHPSSFPENYSWHPDKGIIWRKPSRETDPETGLEIWSHEDVVISDVLFYPLARVRTADDLHSMNIYMRDKQGHVREFVLDHGVVAGGDKTLFTELGRREISLSAKFKPEIANYLNAWIGKLRDEHTATPSIEQFGWYNNGFILGKDYITPDGNRRAILNSSAHKFEEYFQAKGTLEAWVAAVDRAYNYPGQEALQFCVLTAFAAPLWSMFGENGGVTVYAHSAGSGYGKTTAQQVGLSAWGLYPELVLRESNFTEGALYQHIGVMKNLPVIIDEMTNCSNDFASKLVYNMSAGKGKSRLTSDATMKKSLNWATIAAASGNNLLTEKLSLHRANAEAEMARVWEFTVRRKGEVDPNAALELFHTFTDNYGHAGREFIKHVVENYDEVKALLYHIRQLFNERERIQHGERFWSALHACILTALIICKQLRILRFSLQNMQDWISAELKSSRIQMLGSVSDPLEQFGDMLSDLWAGVLVTLGEGSVAHGAFAPVIGHPRGTITGRSILDDGRSAEKLFISSGAAKAWCNRLGVSFKEMHEGLVNAGWADKHVKRVSLGKGTEQYSGLGGPVKCWEINPSAVRSVMGAHPIAQKVHRVIAGSDNDAGRDRARS